MVRSVVVPESVTLSHWSETFARSSDIHEMAYEAMKMNKENETMTVMVIKLMTMVVIMAM
jgi:hypothetical protein